MRISINYDIKNKSAVIHLGGEIDYLIAPTLKDCIVGLDPRVEKLDLDLSEVSYFGLGGVRVITILYKKFKNNLRIINASGKVLDTLNKVGISKLVEIIYKDHSDEYVLNSIDYLNTDFKKIVRDKLRVYPDEVFIRYRIVDYSWRKIEVISQIIANDLSNLGVKQNDFVALSSINSANLICTLFAIEKLGAVCVLVNPSYSSHEVIELSKTADFNYYCYGDLDVNNEDQFLKDIVSDDSNIKAIFNVGSNIDFYSRIDEYEDIKDKFNDVETNTDDPAIMIFTSGSTGTPKGAVHSFFTLIVSGLYLKKQENVNSKDHFCSTLPMFHIAGFTLDFMNALITGATICIPDIKKGFRLKDKTKAILNTIKEEKCSVLNGVPASILFINKLDGFASDDVDSITNVMVCAQPITQNQMDELIHTFNKAKIHNLYGMTEHIPISIVSSDDGYAKLINSVGNPDYYCYVKVINKQTGEVCSVDEVGEIVVSGYDSLGCYYKKDESVQPLNDKGYIETGDLGFFDKDRYLHIVGRIKDIIIRGGENIVPRQIEEAIAKIDCIYDVHVCGVPDGPMGEKVAAGIILKPGYSFDEEYIKTQLEKNLSLNEIPRIIKEYKEFPLLANGKLDKISFKNDLIEYSKQ